MSSSAHLVRASFREKLLVALAPPRKGRLWARLARAPKKLWLVALVAFVFWLYRLYVSAGVAEWPVYGVFHDMQADGFLKGQLSLPLAPAPELLRAKNPFDRAYMGYWPLDASFYKGKFYIYWGPVPALCEALAKWLLRIKQPLGDQYLMLFFLCLAAWCGALLIERVARRLFPGLPRTLVAIGVLAFACANPTLHAAATASTYHTAIIAGQAWLVAGLVFAFDAAWYAGTARARSSRLLLAGICWALAMASRVTLLPAVALLIAITACAEAFAAERRFRRWLASALWLGVPVAITGLALLAYNKARFDEFLEFGSKLQLSGFPTLRFSTRFVIPNLYAYLLRPWFSSCEFPYLFQEWWAPEPFPRMLLPLPPDYLSPEPVIGCLVAVPLAWLAPFAFGLAPRPRGFATRHTRVFWFCLLSFAVLASVSGMVIFGVYGATMRYLSDITYGLVLLALLGAFALRSHAFGRYLPRSVSTLVGVLGMASVVIGLLVGYQGYNAHFHRYNPKLDRTLTKELSLCGKKAGKLPAWMRSPTFLP